MTLLEVRNLTVDFRVASGSRLLGNKPTSLRAVDHVSLKLEVGASMALVGESGSGKSTLARAIVGLVEPTGGEVLIEGDAVDLKPGNNALRRRAQMIFQDPAGSLNPAMTVERALTEPLLAHHLATEVSPRSRCRELVEMVELPPRVLSARPRQLSGGQRQRVAIARALALEPDLLIADEAAAALDVSVQAAIVNLLRQLQGELGLSLLFISHDLAVVRQLCDQIAVMYVGAIIEHGRADAVLRSPQHPYTRALLSAAPRLEQRRADQAARAVGEPPSPLAVPPACRFHPALPDRTRGPM